MAKKQRTPAQLASDKRLGMRRKLEAARELIAQYEAENDTSDPEVHDQVVFDAVEAVGIAPNPNPRATRSAETRENVARRKPWAPPSMLDAPTPPDGYKHRWLRAGMVGEDDKINMGKRMREGYEPVRADEYPDYQSLPIMDEGKHAGVFGVGGLILAKIPEETVTERNEYYSKKARSQMTAIDTELAGQSHSAMPLSAPDRKSQTTFGNPENKPEI